MIYKYPHMERFRELNEPKLEVQQRIFLWGAGKLGSVVAYSLSQRGIDFEAFIDIAKDKQGKIYCDHKVISPEEFEENDKDTVVICSCAYPNAMDGLREKGYSHVYDPIFLLKEIDFSEYNGRMEVEYAARITESALRNYELYYKVGMPIERLYFVITEKCSLKCKNCDGYMPYYENPRNDSLQNIIECYEKIVDVYGSVETIDIFGGEPLVHPDIDKIVKFFVEDKRCEKVTIISNGTILPNSHLLEVLKTQKCIFRISDYGKLSYQKEKLISILKKEGIKYELTNYAYWDSVPKIQKMDQSLKELDKKFAACAANYFYVKHGRLHCCSFVTGLSGLGDDLLPDFDKNYVELINDTEKNVKENIKKYVQNLRERKHIDACKYCPGSHCIQFEDKQPVAEQADGVLPIDNLFKGGKRICF